MLTASDLEVNVLEFRQRSFQFERLGAVGEEEVAVFYRTETESESQFRPRLVHLRLLVPLAWVVLDAENDTLAIARDGQTVPVRLAEPVVEVGAEPPEFQEQGIGWMRRSGPSGALVYAPAERASEWLSDAAFVSLGIT